MTHPKLTFECIRKPILGLFLFTTLSLASCANNYAFAKNKANSDGEKNFKAITADSGAIDSLTKCKEDGERKYQSKFHNLAVSVLKSESQACFVPDESFMLLDSILQAATDSISSIIRYTDSVTAADSKRASLMISKILAGFNFQTSIPVDYLRESLQYQRSPKTLASHHYADCDIYALIYYAIGVELNLPITIAEYDINSFMGHSIICWTLKNAEFFLWDPNYSIEMPLEVFTSKRGGKIMSSAEVRGYYLGNSARIHHKYGKTDSAVSLFKQSINLYARSALLHDGLSWTIATTKLLNANDSDHLKELSIREAKIAVKLDPNPEYYNTLGCAYANRGYFDSAMIAIDTAITLLDNNPYQPKELKKYKRYSQKFTRGENCVEPDM